MSLARWHQVPAATAIHLAKRDDGWVRSAAPTAAFLFARERSCSPPPAGESSPVITRNGSRLMREQLSTPAEPVPSGDDPLHTSIIHYKYRVGFTPRTDLEAIGAWLRSMDMTGHLARCSGAELRVLCVLAARTNGDKLRESQVMFSWPGEVLLATQAGVRGGSVYRVPRDLAAIGLLKPDTQEIDGEQVDGWALVPPDLVPSPAGNESTRTFRKKKVRKFRGIEDRHYARATGGARNETTRRAPPAARGARHGRRAQNAESTLDNARACAPAQKSETLKRGSSTNNTTTGSSSSSTPMSPDLAAAAAELEGAGIGAAKIKELVNLPTTTRLITRAAIIEASKKPEEKRRGLIVYLLHNPHTLAQTNISAATRQLSTLHWPAEKMTSVQVDRHREDQTLAALSESELVELVDRVLKKAPAAGKLRDNLEAKKHDARSSIIWRSFLLSELKLATAAEAK